MKKTAIASIVVAIIVGVCKLFGFNPFDEDQMNLRRKR